MEIQKIVTGMLDENCYVLKNNGTCLVVDPGDDYIKIKEAIGENKVLGILLTHSHFDHVGALRHFLTKRSIKIFKRSSVEEKEYQIGDFSFETIFTPVHSKDSISCYFKEELPQLITNTFMLLILLLDFLSPALTEADSFIYYYIDW